MATTTEPAKALRRQAVLVSEEQRIALRGVSWATYQKLVEEIGDRRTVLFAYNRGVLELMSPGSIHEDYKVLLRRLIEVVSEELDIPCKGMGSTKWDHEEAERGVEADECYMLTAVKVAASRHRSPRSSDYPFPDLAVEIDMRRSAVDRAEIYATMGVPEVWRFDGLSLRIDRLREDGAYEPAVESRFLPIPPAEVARWVLRDDVGDQNAWARQLRDWVRAELLPRRAGGG